MLTNTKESAISSEKFFLLRKKQYLCTRKKETAGKISKMVRWMSGLVSGLQNQQGRFDSATHLKSVGFFLRFFRL